MHAVSCSLPPYQHMSAIVTVSASGEAVPPFIILSNLQKVPVDLQDLVSQAWWGSSANGWVTKRLFTCWAVNFAHWLTKYRERINASPDARALLFLDGHASRINFSALEYLSRAHCDVIVLPAHTSHITQAFDVGIASTLKAVYKKLLLKFTRTTIANGQVFTAPVVHRIAIVAFLDAHREVLTVTRQRMAFEAVGILPFDPNIPLRSPFVQPGASRPLTSRFTINGYEVTAVANLNTIRAYQESRPGNPQLTAPIVPEEFHVTSLQSSQTEGRLLSRFESAILIDPNGLVSIKRFT